MKNWNGYSCEWVICKKRKDGKTKRLVLGEPSAINVTIVISMMSQLLSQENFEKSPRNMQQTDGILERKPKTLINLKQKSVHIDTWT